MMPPGVLAFLGPATHCELLDSKAALRGLSSIHPGALMESEENYQKDGET